MDLATVVNKFASISIPESRIDDNKVYEENQFQLQHHYDLFEKIWKQKNQHYGNNYQTLKHLEKLLV